MSELTRKSTNERNIQRFIHCNNKSRELSMESEAEFIKQAGNISLPQLQVVLSVAAHAPCTMSHLAEVMKLSQANITQLVTRLVNNKYLKRIRSKEDRRVVYVDLLSKGKNIIKLHDAHVRNFAKLWFDVMTIEEQEIMLSAWERVIEQSLT